MRNRAYPLSIAVLTLTPKWRCLGAVDLLVGSAVKSLGVERISMWRSSRLVVAFEGRLLCGTEMKFGEGRNRGP